ncbi:unnamed protein product, partial [Meganyctiphanes norvegica]
ETKMAIREFTKKPELQNVDSSIFIFMSHGIEESFYTKDGVEISRDFIVNELNNQKCPALEGKPKFFIFNCCRGHEIMIPVEIGKMQTATKTDIKDSTTTYLTHPIEVNTTDACIIHSTVP